ncbi:hypothetical protein MNBD_GAMMA25-679 [hydrothermal vent metagenome]|uniref:SHOCT domain-containing protein n=1 Tax=hydrothermal vent metagenome TaxID=652676 RepID=A0A3B1AS59_9ZZZZ
MGPLFWIFIIVGVVLLARWLTGLSNTDSENHGRESALEILNKRYARGEIDRETYARMKQDLEL